MSHIKQIKSKGFYTHKELTVFINDRTNKVSITDTMFIIHDGQQFVLFYF